MRNDMKNTTAIQRIVNDIKSSIDFYESKINDNLPHCEQVTIRGIIQGLKKALNLINQLDK